MRIGVFDIGTRATRLLISDTEDHGFRKNFGQLTRMGEDFDDDDNIRIEGFQRTIRVLQEFLEEGARFGVKEYVAVGTAALRRAKNSDQLMELLRNILGLHVTILQKEDEAHLSLLSAFFHFEKDIEKHQPILLLDQGGGSTEISCGELIDEGFRFWGHGSLDLGSVLLKNLFLADDRRLVGESYRATMSHIEREISRHDLFPMLKDRPPVQAFGMGSAITNITGVRGNRRQHGRVITAERMQYLINSVIDLYEANQSTIEELLEGPSAHERMDELERDLLVLYGLPVYQSLLKTYHLGRITVCGYGLRYGVFLYAAMPGITEREIPLLRTPAEDILDAIPQR